MKLIARRLLFVGVSLVTSFVIINYTKARSPYYIPKVSYAAACIPAPQSKRAEEILDEKLKPYYHLVYTSKEPAGSAVTSYRCYFRFPASDVACMPSKVALRNTKVEGCPQFVKTEDTACYFLNPKYQGLQSLLKRRPPVSKDNFQTKVVKNWTDVRDVLLSINPQVTSKEKTREVSRPG